ncbi:MAG: hypothetical protein ABMA64_36090 [Myxococcota bacterium]
MALVAANPYSSPQVFVTTADGRRQVFGSRAFLASRRNEPLLTISSDWCRSGLPMDGFVLGAFRSTGGVAVERYEFGMLNDLRAEFFELVYQRFLTVELARSPALLVIDAEGGSSDPWIAAYHARVIGFLPAALVVASRGSFTMQSPLLVPCGQGSLDAFCNPNLL